MAKVGIVMGSDSDMPVMAQAAAILEKLGIDFETDFDDYGCHTNAFGMEKCSAFLGEYLSTHYDFEDKRGREGYESWDKAAELWEEQTESAKQTILDKIARKEFKVIEEEE